MNGLTFTVTADLPEEHADALEQLCEDRGVCTLTSWGLEGSGLAQVCAYFETIERAQSACDELSAITDAQFPDLHTVWSVNSQPTEDWQNAWKKFFKPAKVSRRVVVRPSWEEWQGEKDCVEVIIDPGLTFGTGLHPTTRACISFLDDIGGEGKSLLDAGCGSGILSVTAAKLGYSPIRAFDIDPAAVTCSHENMSRNELDVDFEVSTADLADISAGRAYDVAAVNILAPIIIENADVISALVNKPDGALALSGIHRDLFESVRKAFESRGYVLSDSITEDIWTSGLFSWRS